MKHWLTVAFLFSELLHGDSFYTAREWKGSITSRSMEHPSHATIHYEGLFANDLVSYRIGYSACIEAVHQQPDLAAASVDLEAEEPDPEFDIEDLGDADEPAGRLGYRSSRQVAFPDPARGTSFAPLGLLDLPFWGWRSAGFINVKVNRYDIRLARPKFEVLRARGKDAALQVTWPIQDADVVQTFVLRDGDDKLLLEIKIVPFTKKIEDLKISFGYQMAGSSRLWTPRGEGAANDATRRYPGAWTVLPGSKGNGPGALLWLPVKGMKTTLTGAVQFDFKCPPDLRKLHFAVWAFPKAKDESAAQYMKTHATEFGKAVSAFAADGWKPGATPVTLPRRPSGSEYSFSENEAQDGFAIYSVPLFDRVLIDTVPSKDLLIESLESSGAPGAIAPMSFVLFSERALEGLEVSVQGPLSGPKGQIARDALDLRVVKVWHQRVAGIAHEGDLTRQATPELLMPRDKQAMSIPAGSSRQFWLTAYTDEDTLPGDYQGQVLIKTSEGRERRLPILIKVQPFLLQRPKDKIFALDVLLRPAGKEKESAWNTVPAVLYSKYLNDIREHGINVVGIPADSDAADEMLQLQKNAGLLEGPLLVLNPPGTEEDHSPEQSKKHWEELTGAWKKRAVEVGASKTVFGFTEWTQASRQACQILNGSGHQTLAFLNWKEAETHEGIVQVPVIEHSRRGRAVFLEARDLCREHKGSPLYTWPAWMENPKLNRLLAGFYLWSVGFDGFVARSYQVIEGDAYDNTDGQARDRCLSWPSKEGPIPTLQWEALREGITDYCYLHTLALRLKAAEKAGAEKAKAAEEIRTKLSSLLKKYSHEATYLWGTYSPQSYNFPYAYQSVSNATFAADRKQIENWILDLPR